MKPLNKEVLARVLTTWRGVRVTTPQPSLFDMLALDIATLPSPDFIIADLVRPKTGRVLVCPCCCKGWHCQGFISPRLFVFFV